uniref:Uncharacterized protein n=1 Tax=Anguilla anguilla TaxID=7936 RepID=A0A0E9S9R9_ANGAN
MVVLVYSTIVRDFNAIYCNQTRSTESKPERKTHITYKIISGSKL